MGWGGGHGDPTLIRRPHTKPKKNPPPPPPPPPTQHTQIYSARPHWAGTPAQHSIGTTQLSAPATPVQIISRGHGGKQQPSLLVPNWPSSGYTVFFKDASWATMLQDTPVSFTIDMNGAVGN